MTELQTFFFGQGRETEKEKILCEMSTFLFQFVFECLWDSIFSEFIWSSKWRIVYWSRLQILWDCCDSQCSLSLEAFGLLAAYTDQCFSWKKNHGEMQVIFCILLDLCRMPTVLRWCISQPDFMEKHKWFQTMWIDFYKKVSRSTNLTPK